MRNKAGAAPKTAVLFHPSTPLTHNLYPSPSPYRRRCLFYVPILDAVGNQNLLNPHPHLFPSFPWCIVKSRTSWTQISQIKIKIISIIIYWQQNARQRVFPLSTAKSKSVGNIYIQYNFLKKIMQLIFPGFHNDALTDRGSLATHNWGPTLSSMEWQFDTWSTSSKQPHWQAQFACHRWFVVYFLWGGCWLLPPPPCWTNHSAGILLNDRIVDLATDPVIGDFCRSRVPNVSLKVPG